MKDGLGGISDSMSFLAGLSTENSANIQVLDREIGKFKRERDAILGSGPLQPGSCATIVLLGILHLPALA